MYYYHTRMMVQEKLPEKKEHYGGKSITKKDPSQMEQSEHGSIGQPMTRLSLEDPSSKKEEQQMEVGVVEESTNYYRLSSEEEEDFDDENFPTFRELPPDLLRAVKKLRLNFKDSPFAFPGRSPINNITLEDASVLPKVFESKEEIHFETDKGKFLLPIQEFNTFSEMVENYKYWRVTSISLIVDYDYIKSPDFSITEEDLNKDSIIIINLDTTGVRWYDETRSITMLIRMRPKNYISDKFVITITRYSDISDEFFRHELKHYDRAYAELSSIDFNAALSYSKDYNKELKKISGIDFNAWGDFWIDTSNMVYCRASFIQTTLFLRDALFKMYLEEKKSPVGIEIRDYVVCK